MTIPDANQEKVVEQPQISDKELNFRAQQAKYEKMLLEQRAETERLQRELEQRQQYQSRDEDDDSDPYIDHKKLEKKLAKFGENTMKVTQTEIQKAVQIALHEERKSKWMDENKDFHDVMQPHILEKFQQKAPNVVNTILSMPDSFERQKLVYENIKALGLDKPAPKESSIQERIDSNRKTPYYQPSGVGTAPYASQGDFSAAGQKQSYSKLQELKARLNLNR